jgi:GxxExxY protein
MPEQEFLYKDLTYAIIGAAMEVHRVLGHGFLESVYEEALAYEFNLQKIAYERQANLQVPYKEIIAGLFRADFLVEGKVVVELKAIKALTENDEAQLLNYLKGTRYRVGLLLNFGAPSLEHKRRIL